MADNEHTQTVGQDAEATGAVATEEAQASKTHLMERVSADGITRSMVEGEPEDDVIVDVDHVTVRFNLERNKTDTLKEYVIKYFKRQLEFDEFFALKDVSFKVKRGESLALVGRNGSGKSTMLKTIAGIYYPWKGSVTVNGTIAPLIELGAGFDMDLTARENVYLNGAVLGHDRAFMDEHFDSIVEFAELQDFMDVPVKNYSSGMVSRLGFSIATAVRADILIVDEVLSVGDFQFQEKCKNRMNEMLEEGTTLLFVSHSTDQVRELCKNAVWLDHGVMKQFGPANDVCDAYVEYYNHEPE
jgi:ABC-type polysaccharide/polyol phosphate transport system ATPase subunit